MIRNIFTKSVSYSFLCIIGLLAIIVSCSKSRNNQILHLPPQLSMPDGRIVPEEIKNVLGIRMNGSLTLYYTTNGEILISLTDNINRGINFILQTSEKESVLAKIEKIESAELMYMGDFILINDLNAGKISKYWVNSTDYETTWQILPPELKKAIKDNIYGIGLSYHKGIWSALNENIDLGTSIFMTLYPHEHSDKAGLSDLPPDTRCESGGPGSTSCNHDCGEHSDPRSCGVTCSAGYYSCCRCLGAHGIYGASCICLKN
jgi:hypothetical protein